MDNNPLPTAPINTQTSIQNPQSVVQTLPATPNQPPNPPPVQVNQVKNNNKKIILIILFTLFIILIIGVSVFALFGKPVQVATPSNSITTNKTKTNAIQPPTPSLPGPFTYGSVNVDNISLKIDKVIRDAHVQGTPPDSGKQYLEIDFSVTYMGKTTGIIPGVFYYQDSSGNLIPTADTNIAGVPIKKITIPNKLVLYGVPLEKGKTVNNAYLLYQIPTGDHGKLIWINTANPSISKQRVTFTLF